MSVKWVSIGSGNGLSPVWHQTITWTRAGLLTVGTLGTNFSEIWNGILLFSFKKMHLKLPSVIMAAILSRGRWVSTKSCLIQVRDFTESGSKSAQCFLLTHWGRDKMAAIFQTTFWNGFSWMKMYEFQVKFHWSLFLEVQLTTCQHWFR